MKLRIQDNSPACACFTQKEVARLGDQGSVESGIRFSEDYVLRYCVLISTGCRDSVLVRHMTVAAYLCVFARKNCRSMGKKCRRNHRSV